jgi:chemotaxis response regulator CheB
MKMTDRDNHSIRVLIVDDSAAFRAALALALDSDEQSDVVGQASDGTERRLVSVVYGMPRAAAKAGACCEVLALDEIAPRIAGMSQAHRAVSA